MKTTHSITTDRQSRLYIAHTYLHSNIYTYTSPCSLARMHTHRHTHVQTHRHVHGQKSLRSRGRLMVKRHGPRMWYRCRFLANSFCLEGISLDFRNGRVVRFVVFSTRWGGRSKRSWYMSIARSYCSLGLPKPDTFQHIWGHTKPFSYGQNHSR